MLDITLDMRFLVIFGLAQNHSMRDRRADYKKHIVHNMKASWFRSSKNIFLTILKFIHEIRINFSVFEYDKTEVTSKPLIYDTIFLSACQYEILIFLKKS